MPSEAIATTNEKVRDVLDKSSDGKKSQRGSYQILTPAQKLLIGQRAAEYGTMAAIKFFVKKYPELSLKETTVRHLKNQYQDELRVRQGVPGFKSNLQMDGIRQSFFPPNFSVILIRQTFLPPKFSSVRYVYLSSHTQVFSDPPSSLEYAGIVFINTQHLIKVFSCMLVIKKLLKTIQLAVTQR